MQWPMTVPVATSSAANNVVVPRVAHAGGKQLGDPGPSLDPAQQQHAAVGRQPAAIEAGAQLLVLDG